MSTFDTQHQSKIATLRYPLPSLPDLRADVEFICRVNVREYTQSDGLGYDASYLGVADRREEMSQEILMTLAKSRHLRQMLDSVQHTWLHQLAEEQIVDEGRALTPNEILSLLESDGAADASLVCEAEFVRFGEAERERVTAALWHIIVERRDSNCVKDIAAVGAAIRKFVAMMDVRNIGQLAQILNPNNRSPAPLDIELEICRMVHRKFAAHPDANPGSEHDLETQLTQIAEVYSSPRLIARIDDGYPTVAMLAYQSLAVMLAPSWDRIIPSLNRAPLWFRQQLKSRIQRTVSEWHSRGVAKAESLEAIARQIQT
jgi:hypothetical protein